MKAKFVTACLVAAALAGSTAIASAQGGSTDRNGNANGSQNVGNGAMKGGAMHNGTTGTTGMSRTGQDSPNGSPGAPPTAKQGPGGDPSKNNDAPK
jgi:hypothetical protein